MLPPPPTPTSGSPEETLPPVTLNLSSDAIGNFLRAQFGTGKFDQQDFPEFRDVVRKKTKNLKKKKKKKKESTIVSDNEASHILELSLQKLLSTKIHKIKKYKTHKQKQHNLQRHNQTNHNQKPYQKQQLQLCHQNQYYQMKK